MMTVSGAISMILLSGVLSVIVTMVAGRWRDVNAALDAGRAVRPLADPAQLMLPLRFAA